MKKSKLFLSILFTVLAIFIFGCQNHLLPSPKVETPTDDAEQKNPEVTIWAAPENLVATHGLKGKIELSWKGVKSASRYYIYEAPTPYDRFIQIAETTSNTQNYVLEENSGASKYYKITAVKKDGEESPFSTVAHGTTLANPVITYIGQDEENSDSASSVLWYMNNCNASTYQQNVRYTINCFDPAGNNVAEKIHDGNSDYPSIKFEDLTPNTNYTYQVTAYIVSHQNDTEISDKVDSATARRLRPNPPENLSATLGTSTSEITLTFDLPAMVDVALGNGIYEPKPLYFKIYRRVASEEAKEEDWQIIESKFSQQTFSTQYTPSSPDTPYEPGQTVTYVDIADLSELKRGIMYEYKIQSYADETTREISSNLSYTTTQGFLMAVPKFETANYEITRDYKGTADESDDIYTEIKTGFSFTWNMLGYEKDYAYILAEKRYKLEVDNNGEKDEIGEPETYEYFTTLESVNEKVKIFDLTDESNWANIRGYYTYTLYIIKTPGENFTLPQPGEPIQNPINVLTAFGTTLVTQDTTAPEITGFTTQDGYKDRVILSWTYDETIAKYTITYELEDGTENVIEDFSAIIEGKQNGDKLTFEHFVESGFSATYTLTALRGISVETEPVTLSTLGTPKLIFDAENPKYDKISVKWNPVNKVETYELSYSLDGTVYSEPIIIPTPTQESVNPENFIVNTDGSYTYNFVHPESYDDATKAGKDIQVKIEAKNTLDSTADDITTRLLGPALVSTTSLVANNYTTITTWWNKVEGAKKYLVKRDRYSVDNKTLESSDFYYVNTDGSQVTVQNEEYNTSQIVTINFDGTQFKLLDNSYQNSGNTKWQINQDKINWGFPYHYTVFPLENENDSFDEETLSLAEKVTYSNLDKIESVGSAIGYGHNVTATKSEDPRKVTITWTKPYLSSTRQYTPILWRSESGKNNWEKTDLSLDGTGKFVFIPKYNSNTNVNERITPYDFAIVYEDTSSKPNQTYLDDLASKVDENGEPHNKGYAFAIATKAENVTVNGESGYSEKISWTHWDYSKRTRGPKQDAIYSVNMKNNNLGSEWINVATYKNDGTITPSTYNETTIAIDGNGVKITPNGLSSDDSAIHNGLLKVLRDYKHYVQVIVTRENSNGQVITASFADDEGNMYAYRDISDAELAKATMLAVAYAFYINDGGLSDYSNINNQFKYGGAGNSTGTTFTNRERYGILDVSMWGKFYGHYSLSNYSPSMITPANIAADFLKISTSNSYKFNIKGDVDNYIYQFTDTNKLTVNYANTEPNLSLYSATVTFEAPDNNTLKLSVTKNGTTTTIVDTSDNDTRKRWFPMQIHGDEKYLLNDATYGWW